MIESFRDLIVWQRGMSIPSNIAEGKSLGGQGYPRHLKIALGSRSELETQIELAKRLQFLHADEADRLLNNTTEVGRMLAGLLKSLTRH